MSYPRWRARWHLLPPRNAHRTFPKERASRRRVLERWTHSSNDMKIFVPLDDTLMDRLGLTLEDLVPFDLDYEVLRPGMPFAAAESEAQSSAEPA